MDTIWWIVIALVALPVGWYLMKVIVGVAAPKNLSGRQLLKKQLESVGVDPARLGDECLSEIVEQAHDMANLMRRATGEGFTTEFVRNLENQAYMISAYFKGQERIPVNGGAKLVHPGGAKLVHLTLCGTRCWGVVPVVHRRDPRCFV